MILDDERRAGCLPSSIVFSWYGRLSLTEMPMGSDSILRTRGDSAPSFLRTKIRPVPRDRSTKARRKNNRGHLNVHLPHQEETIYQIPVVSQLLPVFFPSVLDCYPNIQNRPSYHKIPLFRLGKPCIP